MKTLFNIEAEVSSINLRKLNSRQICEYYSVVSRIDRLFALKLFLSLRKEIGKHVYENYLGTVDFKINYCEYRIIEFESVSIHESDLNPLISEYVKKIIGEIESNTLKLEL